MNKVQLYKEVIAILDKYADIAKGDSAYSNLVSTATEELQKLELFIQFGIDLSGWRGHRTWYANGEFIRLGKYGSVYDRTISWSDDGRQPEDEWLYSLCFSCGAYTFHKDYPVATFNAMIDELKSYNPKYMDTANHVLYYADDVAHVVHERFPEIFHRHRESIATELTEIKIAELHKQLQKLMG